MRRKYDLRNKRNFIIILILSIVIICIFSLFIHKYNKASKVLYNIGVGSVVQDVDKNYINIDEDAALKMRWNDNYYLIYQGKKINLGKKVIVYNTISGSIRMYGTFYEINSLGKVSTNKGENVLESTNDAKFYKLDDREYLLVDTQIVSTDRNIQANDYLLVELDKLGNAKLSNNKINLKTINPTTLVTSKYTFDIANEMLKYRDVEIDLKKIIGSSNEYKELEKEETTGNNGSTGNNNRGTTNVNNGGTGQTISNNANKIGEDTSIDEIRDKTKMTSVISDSVGVTWIAADYVIYDPYDEYRTVYAKIEKPGKIEVVHLSKDKSDMHVVFDNLTPNTTYTISFVYTTVSEDGTNLLENTFEEITRITKMPTYDISLLRISGFDNLITYKVDNDKSYNASTVKVLLSFPYTVTDPETMEVSTERKEMSDTINLSNGIGTFNVAGYNISNDAEIKLTIDSVSGEDGTLEINKTKSFRFVR